MSGMRPVSGIHTSGHALFWYTNNSWEKLIATSAVFYLANLLFFHSFCFDSSRRGQLHLTQELL
jgi:hypothetical protein